MKAVFPTQASSDTRGPFSGHQGVVPLRVFRLFLWMLLPLSQWIGLVSDWLPPVKAQARSEGDSQVEQKEMLERKAAELSNQAFRFYQSGNYSEARKLLEEVLAIRQQLYSKEEFPNGHPDLAQSLNNLGALLQAQGEYAKALPYFEQALAMRQRLYPQDKYPQGHPDLAS